MGSRIQPLACSKELLPVGSRTEGIVERPRAISEYLLDRMKAAGVEKFCFVIGPHKLDIMEYYGERAGEGANIVFVIQRQPAGLCDAIFRCIELIHPDERVLVGLPDTLWFPEDGLASLPDDRFSFLLFPVAEPSLFDAVVFNEQGGRISEIQVKQKNPRSHWVWGAFKLPGLIFHELYGLWNERDRQDEYVGTLVNAWLARGGVATAVPYGEIYVDVGTLSGYRRAIRLLSGTDPAMATSVPHLLTDELL